MSLQQGTLVNMSDSVVATTPWETSARNLSNAKIIVCQKSGCLKRGGKRLLLELEKMLCDRGLEDQVIIEFRRSCLKYCGSAPNYILQIGNKEYKKLHPEAILSFLANRVIKLIKINPAYTSVIRDNRCLWAQLSVPSNGVADSNIYSVLESVWTANYAAWQFQFLSNHGA